LVSKGKEGFWKKNQTTAITEKKEAGHRVKKEKKSIKLEADLDFLKKDECTLRRGGKETQ